MTQITDIKSEKLKELISEGHCYIIDVREPDEYKSGHIPGAQNIPLGTISPDTLAHLDGKKIIFYCQSGIRSLKFCNKAVDILKTEVFNLEGGLPEWKKLGKKVVKQGCGFSIIQQVHMIVGSMVLLGVVLSQLHHELWMYFSAFFGAGLFFAGLTGWCGMAKLLFLMPWNK